MCGRRIQGKDSLENRINMLSPEDILGLPDAARRNIRLLGSLRRRGGKKRSHKRGSYLRRPIRKGGRPSKDAVVSYIKRLGIKKASKWVEEDDESPRLSDALHYFGTWTNACNEVWGLPDWMKMVNAEYLLKCVSEFGIWTKTSYISARRLRPDIIPPIGEVKYYWGRLDNLFECARRKDLRKCITEYSKLVISNGGKFPSPSALQQKGFRIGPAVKIFGSKEKFDDFVDSYIKGRAIGGEVK